MNKDNALNDLMHFLSIEGITGQEKNIALAVKQSLIEAKVPEEYVFFGLTVTRVLPKSKGSRNAPKMVAAFRGFLELRKNGLAEEKQSLSYPQIQPLGSDICSFFWMVIF